MKETEFNVVYLSLGSNVGDKFLHLNNAIDELRLIGKIEDISPIFESQPWGFESDNQFYNTTVMLRTQLSPNELLSKTKQIEKKLGRTQKTQNNIYSDRIIDIDILFYNNLVFSSEELTIPHPLLQKRTFVLYPLQRIAPDLKHPILNKTIESLYKNCKDTEIKEIDKKLR